MRVSKFHCFKPPSVWSFVRVALGTAYERIYPRGCPWKEGPPGKEEAAEETVGEQLRVPAPPVDLRGGGRTPKEQVCVQAPGGK